MASARISEVQHVQLLDKLRCIEVSERPDAVNIELCCALDGCLGHAGRLAAFCVKNTSRGVAMQMHAHITHSASNSLIWPIHVLNHRALPSKGNYS